MSRYFQAGAKAKAALAERKPIETRPKERKSDNASIVALPRPIGMRPKRINAVRDKAKQGKKLCEHCRWQPPTPSILHAHHVVPISCGGADAVENLIVLCPNCHAVAHYVAQRTNLTRTYSGPVSPDELRSWIRAATNPSHLKALQQARMLAHVAPILSALRA